MIGFFEQFAGENLGRLISCLQAVHEAGLGVSKQTQAGVNRYTGAVWIDDDEWSGCVSCSVHGVVSWSHSCQWCGSSFKFDTYNQLDAHSKKHWKCEEIYNSCEWREQG